MACPYNGRRSDHSENEARNPGPSGGVARNASASLNPES